MDNVKKARSLKVSEDAHAALMAALVPGQSVDAYIRLHLGLPGGLRRGRPSVQRVVVAKENDDKYAILRKLEINQSVVLPWIFAKGETPMVTNADALRTAVNRAAKATGHLLQTAGTPRGLQVTRAA